MYKIFNHSYTEGIGNPQFTIPLGIVNITFKRCEPKCRISKTNEAINNLNYEINNLNKKKDFLVQATTTNYDDPYFNKKILLIYKDVVKLLSDNIDQYNNNYISFRSEINKLYNIQKKNEELINVVNKYNNLQQQASIEIDKINNDYKILS